MVFKNFIGFVLEIFGFTRKDNIFVGLSRLREVKEPVLQEIHKTETPKDVKISDLMKGGHY